LPYLGKLLVLVFIPFAAAFIGRSLELSEYPALLGVGTLSLFGGPILAIPHLLGVYEIPSDMFQLFLLSGVLTARFGDLLGVVNLFAFVVITTCVLTGSFRIRWRKLAWTLASSAVVVVIASSASHAWLSSFKDDFRRDKIIASMHVADSLRETDAVILESRAPNPTPLRAGQSHLDRIRERGVLRMGFNDDNLPYVFRNAHGELVGLDVEMAYELARDLGARLELVSFDRETLAEQLDRDHFDIAIGGLLGTLERSQRMHLSRPYLDATLGLLVRDHLARDLDSYEKIIGVRSLRVGLLGESQLAAALRRKIPVAETVVVPSAAWFLEEDHDLDALLISAEAGAAYSMIYPSYQVVVPTRRQVTMPMVFAMPSGDDGFADFIDFWISAQEGTGRLDELTDYWVRGEGVIPPQPRWSVLRDVLGLVD